MGELEGKGGREGGRAYLGNFLDVLHLVLVGDRHVTTVRHHIVELHLTKLRGFAAGKEEEGGREEGEEGGREEVSCRTAARLGNTYAWMRRASS